MEGQAEKVEGFGRMSGADTVPGTEVMVDPRGFHLAKSNGNEIVLIPQPTDDPHDPLNWSPLWKFLAISTTTLFTFAQGIGPLAIAPIFPELAKDFHSDIAGVVHFTGVTILVLGFSSFLWIPLSDTFGRRLVLLSSTLLFIGSYAWKATASTYSSFMGAAVLTGIAAGPGETLPPTIIADVMFLHQRGGYNTLYFVTFYSSVMLGPIIEGAMASNVGWRNFWWLNVAINAFVFFAVLFCFPETKWDRRDARAPAKFTQVPEDVRGNPSPSSVHKRLETQGMAGMEPQPKQDIPVIQDSPGSLDARLSHGRPCKAQWRLFQSAQRWPQSLISGFFLPWKLFFYPIVQFASFVVSFSSTCYLNITFIQSGAFGRAPYHFNSQQVGFTNFASLVGALLGLLTAGPASDMVSAALTKRNEGIREPEMRLLTMVPYVLIMILGNFVVAFGLQHLWDWRVVVIIGFTCAGIQIAALPSIAATYAVDSYKPAAGSIFILVTVNKNLWGYGVSQFITPWVDKAGYVPPFMTNMSLAVLWCSCGVIFWFYGKRFRVWTANSSVHRM